MSGIIVTIAHVRQIDLCSRGLRAWLLSYGFDVSDAVHNGIPIEKLEALDDCFAAQVCEIARKEHENGQ